MCDSVIRDAQTGKVNVQGVFDTIFVRELPAIHSSTSAYFRLKFDAPKSGVVASLAFGSPSGIKHITPDLPITNIGPTGMTEGWVNIQGLQFTEFGEHQFELLINGESVARYFLIVQQLETVPHGQQLH